MNPLTPGAPPQQLYIVYTPRNAASGAIDYAVPIGAGDASVAGLLHSLAGNNAAACRDSFAAAELLKRQQTSRPDPVLVEEINLRRRSCQALAKGRPFTTPPKAAAPSRATPAAATP